MMRAGEMTNYRRWVPWCVLPVAAALLGSARPQAAPGLPDPQATIGRKVTGFKLKDATGKTWSPAELKGRKAVVLVFMGVSCPISNSYAEPLSNLATRFASQGVQFLGVNANPAEDRRQVADHAKEYRISFPILKDDKQTLANQVGARVTPEAFVLDGGQVIRYRGRIDDAYTTRTKRKSQVSSNDLELALAALLAGKPVEKAVTQAFGCTIARPQVSASAASGPMFHRDVLPILQERCQTCHRPGQVAPFSLLTYGDAKNWAQEIRYFTQSRQMPPWKPEPGHGEFMDARRLPDSELATLAAWVEQGAPEGSAKDAPAPKQWADGWMLGTPDLVLSMPEEYSVTATGKDDFRCFVLPTGLREDRAVVAVELKPGNPRVVHHVLNFIDVSGKGRELDARDEGPGYNSGPGGIGFFPAGGVGGWAPGNLPRLLPDGVGRGLPKGSDIVMQVHYHKTGKPERDRTQFGLYFAKEPIKKMARTLPFTNLAIDIPPNEPRHPVTAQMTLPWNVHAFAITPHMHLLGREIKVTATLPDGTEMPLVWIKDWDYRWQDSYRFKEQVALPKGTRLSLTAYYDNSTGNPLNPNTPPKRVRFGEETTDEMCFAFLEYVFDQEPAGLFRAPGGILAN